MSQYLPEVAWSTLASNVSLGPSSYRYYVTTNPLDPNEPGAPTMTMVVGDWFIDYAGYPFLIEGILGSVITVYDILERGDGITSAYGPYADKVGFVYRPKNGAFLLTQAQLRKLDASAIDIITPIEKGILWKYRGIEIDALYGDSEVIETIAQESVNNITKLSLSPEFILRVGEDGWWGGKKYSLSLDGLLHNNLQGAQGTGLDDNYIHLDQDQIDALWTKDGLNITRDSAASLTGILSVDEIKSYTSALPLIKKDGNNVRFSTCILSDCVNNRVGIFTETPLDHLHLTGYARISTLAETGNSSIVTSNADGRLIKLPYDNDEGKYLRSDGTWATILTSAGDFLDSVIRMVADSTFDPGTPTNGDRYIILNASSIHANFGTINKFSDGSALTLGNNDIVQYFSANSEFRIVYDSSAAMQPATVTVGTDKNGNTNHQWTYNVTNDTWIDRGAIASHNSLGGLNDGDYKHLTATQYTNFISLTDGSDISNTLHNHNTVYYTKTSIDAFFAGTTPKTGYNKSNWDTVVTDFAGLEIGGRNLLTRSDILAWNELSSTLSMTEGEDEFGHYYRYNFSALYTLNLSENIVFKENTQYVLKAEGILDSGANPRFLFRYTDGTQSSGLYYDGISSLFVSFIISDKNKTIDYITHDYGSDGYVKLYNIQLLEGNKSMKSWSPAPEDQVSDWNTTDANSFSFIKNKPTNLITGTGTAGYLPKFTGTLSLGNSVVYETVGRVGIGTTSPSYDFDSALSTASLGNKALIVGRSNEIWTQPQINSTASLYINYRGYADWLTQFRDLYIANGKGTIIASFIGDGGNVGIGRTPTTHKLEVEGSSLITTKLYLGTTTAPATDTGTLNSLVWDNTTGEVKQRAITGGGGTVTSISAGNGMDFTTISTTGSIVLGTPSLLTSITTNSTTSTSHTHAIEIAHQTSISSSSTPSPTGNYKENEYFLTNLATSAVFAAPSGTPVNGNTLLIRIKDDGTARTLAWNSIYRAIGVTIPTTTTASKTLYIGCIYNSIDSKWDVVSVVKQT